MCFVFQHQPKSSHSYLKLEMQSEFYLHTPEYLEKFLGTVTAVNVLTFSINLAVLGLFFRGV